MYTESPQGLQNYLQDYEKIWPFSGTVLVARQGEIVFRQAYGYANVEHEIPNTVDTRFRIWSVTKSFTAMAIMLLCEQGMLRTSDEIGLHLPRLAHLQGITVAHLLGHTSGLTNYNSLPEFNNKLLRLKMKPEEVLELFIHEPPAFEPGSSFAYNNSGYFLLGLLIEQLSGVKYQEFVTRNILEPLGMKNTCFDNNRTLIPKMASSYQSDSEQLTTCEYMDMSSLAAPAGIVSTVDDLYLWDQALYTEQLVKLETLERIMEPGKFNYGFGWGIDQCHGHRRIQHSGSYRGYRSELHRYPDERLTVIMLSNYEFVPLPALAETLAGLAFDIDTPAPARPAIYELEAGVYEEYMGTYEGGGFKAVVARDGEQLYFTLNDEQTFLFYPISPSRFHSTSGDWEYTFERGGDGKLTFLGMPKNE